MQTNSSGSWDTYGEKVDSVAVGYNQCLDDICKLGWIARSMAGK